MRVCWGVGLWVWLLVGLGAWNMAPVVGCAGVGPAGRVAPAEVGMPVCCGCVLLWCLVMIACWAELWSGGLPEGI